MLHKFLIVAFLWINGFYPSYFISPLDTYENLKERTLIQTTLQSMIGTNNNNLIDAALANLSKDFSFICDTKFYQLKIQSNLTINCSNATIDATGDWNVLIVESNDNFYWFEDIEMFDYLIRYGLSRKVYSQVLIIMPLDFYSTKFNSLQCGKFYSCNFELDFILLDNNCLMDSECVRNRIDTLNYCDKSLNATQKENEFLFNELELFVMILMDSNNLRIVYDQLKLNLVNCVSLKSFDISMMSSDVS